MRTKDEILCERFAPEELQKIAKWWCKFNCWEWPDDFPISKPDEFDTMNNDQKYDDLLFRICIDGLKENSTDMETSKQWWIMNGETEEKWKRWWDNGQSWDGLDEKAIWRPKGEITEAGNQLLVK